MGNLTRKGKIFFFIAIFFADEMIIAYFFGYVNDEKQSTALSDKTRDFL